MVKFAISRNLRKNFGVRLYRGEGGQPQSVQVRTGGRGVQKVAILSVSTLWMLPPLARPLWSETALFVYFSIATKWTSNTHTHTQTHTDTQNTHTQTPNDWHSQPQTHMTTHTHIQPDTQRASTHTDRHWQTPKHILICKVFHNQYTFSRTVGIPQSLSSSSSIFSYSREGYVSIPTFLSIEAFSVCFFEREIKLKDEILLCPIGWFILSLFCQIVL